ncbi:MAG TPA: hypothetical protein VHG51_14930 [Longimicrobiaceae bacterium]|nr:hypothetical protein [Longimicrobiaceae bacterium]
MRRANTLLVRGIFAAGIAAALCFGAAQAGAAPAAPAALGRCYPEACLNFCSQKGFPSGYCSGGVCHCVEF